MQIQFRPAIPEDVEQAIPLIYSSGPAAFDCIFSHKTPINALEFLRRTFIKPVGELGYQNHIVGTFEPAQRPQHHSHSTAHARHAP
ncbi:MAG: hypothetical protein VCC01_03025 [Candidatus Hydrogenedentota bacterium]